MKSYSSYHQPTSRNSITFYMFPVLFLVPRPPTSPPPPHWVWGGLSRESRKSVPGCYGDIEDTCPRSKASTYTCAFKITSCYAQERISSFSLVIQISSVHSHLFFIRATEESEEFLQQHRGQAVFLNAERDVEPDSCLHQAFLHDWGSRIEILGWVVGHVMLSLYIMSGNWRPLLPLKWHFKFGLRASSVSGSMRPRYSRPREENRVRSTVGTSRQPRLENELSPRPTPSLISGEREDANFYLFSPRLQLQHFQLEWTCLQASSHSDNFTDLVFNRICRLL